jgi:hypothetical protein
VIIRGDCFVLLILLMRLSFQLEAVDDDGGVVGEDDEAAAMAGVEGESFELEGRGQPGSPQECVLMLWDFFSIKIFWPSQGFTNFAKWNEV